MGHPKPALDASRAHQYATATIPEIVEDLIDLFGAPQAASMVQVDTSNLYRWRSGAKAPRPIKERNLRTAAHTCGLLASFPRDTVRSWFLTPNQLLDYATPSEALADNGRDVLRAAESFASSAATTRKVG